MCIAGKKRNGWMTDRKMKAGVESVNVIQVCVCQEKSKIERGKKGDDEGERGKV